ncbi:ZmpA/ZmpB/ZmpC family metallo-endopeptidase [Streptococcus sp. E17BB]|uniref:ZmpA/ZmpB/ZmpC family metallo-endopeptidase n=1 Tax=Streptococcus sp. E17BB TaxID=3278714 RepID=UPI00359E7402
MGWNDKQLRFSIRKFKVAVASTVVGIAIFGGLAGLQTGYVAANEQTTAQVQSEKTVTIDYIYVNYDELTPEQQNLLRRTDKDFAEEIATDNQSYVLVYKRDTGLLSLPSTGDTATTLLTLLGSLGIIGVILAVKRQNKHLVAQIIVITGLAGAVLSVTDTEALQTALKHFLTEQYVVTVGEHLPRPKQLSELVDHQRFAYYIFQEELEPDKAPIQKTSPVDKKEEGESPIEQSQKDDLSQAEEATGKDSEQLSQNEATISPVIPTPMPMPPAPPTSPVTPAPPVEGVEVVESRVAVVSTDVDYIDSDELYVGETQLISEAVSGEKLISTSYKTLDGQRTDEIVGSPVETLVSAPVNAKVKRGTKPRETVLPTPTPMPPAPPASPVTPAPPVEGVEVVESRVAVVSTDVDYIDSDELYVGETQLISEAISGEKIVSTTYKTLDGQRTDEIVGTPTEEVTTQPVKAVVKRGTKPIAGQVTEERTEPIAHGERMVEDPEQYTDYRAEAEGADGVLTITETFATVRGQKEGSPLTSSSRVTTAPVDKVITVGTKPIEGTTTVVTTAPVTTPEIDYQDSSDLYEGETQEVSPAVVGEKTIRTVYKTVRGVQTTEVIGTPTEEVTTQPVKAVVKRGTKVRTEAERQNPMPAAAVQTVSVGQRPSAEASVEAAGLTNVASYTWQTGPSTSTVGQNVPGTVLVTYTDQSTDLVPVTINVIQNKTKPNLILEELVEFDEDKKITLNYALEDPTNSYKGATISIYNGDALVREFTLSTMDAFDVSDLDWNITYTLKGRFTYDLEDGNGVKTEDLSIRQFELDYKHLEIKHVVSAGLFQKQTDGTYKQLDMIKEAPTALTDYYVKVNSDQQRDIYLSVNSIEAVEKDGKQLYKVVTAAPELIQYSDDLGKNQDNYTFYVRQFVPSEGNKIRTFADLVTALSANRTGTFELDEDLKADEYTLPVGAKSYVAGNFFGRLLGNNHAIYNLKAPLFEGLQNNFEIRDLDLKQVAINQPAAAEIGALAKTAYGYGEGIVSNVAVQGSILANRSVGGLIYRANNVRLEQVAFEGDITARNSSTANFTGGLIGYAQSNTQVNGAIIDATIRVNGQYAGTRAGGAVGVLEHARTGLTNLVAKGVLDNSSGNTSAYVGGLVGQVIASPQFTNTITEVKVAKGRLAIGNLTNTPSRVFDIVTVNGVSTGSSDETATSITAEAAKAKQDAMGLTVTLADSGIDLNVYNVDYQAVRGAQASKVLAYKNIEKFMPLYNKEFIVKHGNLLAADHDLVTKTVVSVIPMADDRFVSDYLTDKQAINRVMVYFADDTKAYYNVAYLEDFKQTGVAEYQVDGLSLLYTPEQILSHLPSLASRVLPALSGVDYYAPETLTALGKTGNAQELMDKLYLKESFDAIKGNLANVLQGVLSTTDVIATDRTDLAAHIIKNKEALMMGLSYVNRWFNIDFGQVNARDLILYHQDLFGKSASTLDWLISLGQSYDQLKLINHLDTYATITKAYTGVADEFDYLSAYRRLFTSMDENTWFKATSKAYMAEGNSLAKPDAEVRAYHKLLEDGQAKKFILPLLTAREGIFFISNMSTLNFGMFDRYMDMNLKVTDPVRYEAELARVKAMVDISNIRYRDHFDFWYRMSLDSVKDKNIKAVPNWDGYNINRSGLNNGRWLPMFGDTNDAIKDFFGPIDGALWSQFGNNGAGAYATGSYTHFIILKMLEEEGASGHTHEMVHNSDGAIYLGGYGRRFGQGAELYALGMLQAPYTAQTNYFAINNLFDFRGTAAENADNRYHNLSPDRFQTSDDLKDYFRGVFDVLYTLDQVEAETVLSLPKDQQRLFYHKIENDYIQDVNLSIPTHAGNRVRKFTDAEWQDMTLTSVADLIDHDIVSNREFAINSGTSRDYARNGYHTVPFFSAIYSALDNPNGAPGDIMFRRMAFELLAAKGYEGGFLPYVSGQYAQLATDRGITGTETWPRKHTVGRITDSLVFEQVFGSEYSDWKAFKKAMFQERADKLNSLKPVTITYKGATVTISSADQLKQLMAEATREDMNRFLTGTPISVTANNNAYASNSRVKELKAKIFNAYLRQTDDFRTSIYSN